MRARFMLLCHGRVGTASLLESLQGIDEVFVPSYWHTDPLMATGRLEDLFDNSPRISEQCALPKALDDISIGIINHNFPVKLADIKVHVANLHNILADDAKVFIWTRDPVENMVSSYRTYLLNYFIFYCCEGNENAKGIYSAFSSKIPLCFVDFVERYSCTVDYQAQKDLYSQAGHVVHLRSYEGLKHDLQGEVEFILNESGIAFTPEPISQTSYPASDNWAIQVSFAFRNKLMIDGLPLNVGYFKPTRKFPNQGGLTMEIHKNIFVSPDQWFRLPYAYKRRIKAARDPWRIIDSTRERYEVFEKRVNTLIQDELAKNDPSSMTETARSILHAKSVKLDGWH